MSNFTDEQRDEMILAALKLPQWFDRMSTRFVPGEDGHITWSGGKNSGGVGRINLPRNATPDYVDKDVYVLVPRVMLVHKLGRPLAEYRIAWPTCGMPRCINPEHLDERYWYSPKKALPTTCPHCGGIL